jgi:hypothetical protein
MLTPLIKSKMLKNASRVAMHEQRRQSWSPYLVLKVRREHAVLDALNIVRRSLSSLLLPSRGLPEAAEPASVE